MTDVVDDLLAEAAAAIADMREAALRARTLHARAELLRHMRGTAARMRDRPLDEAATRVAGEWMQAWQLDAAAYAAVSAPVARFTRAFCENARAANAATQHEILAAMHTLDAALATQGTSIADQMAWRSECAYGWWDLVAPTPTDLPARASVPRHVPGTPFWETGCAERCRGA
jgi:hypothetical protein